MKILIVEDEKSLSESIAAYLTNEGFLCECALSFEQASQKVHDYQYDVVVVDIMLPGGSGLDIIRELKAGQSPAGVLIISARNALDDKITGLDLGADDYLTKPFHLAELNSRIKSIIRRRQFEGRNKIQFRDIVIDPERASVCISGNTVNLTKKEYDLLLFFAANKNRILTKETIAEHLWGDHIDMADSLDFIFTHIKNLRRKIEKAGGRDYIHTVYGRGYKFSEQQ